MDCSQHICTVFASLFPRRRRTTAHSEFLITFGNQVLSATGRDVRKQNEITLPRLCSDIRHRGHGRYTLWRGNSDATDAFPREDSHVFVDWSLIHYGCDRNHFKRCKFDAVLQSGQKDVEAPLLPIFSSLVQSEIDSHSSGVAGREYTQHEQTGHFGGGALVRTGRPRLLKKQPVKQYSQRK